MGILGGIHTESHTVSMGMTNTGSVEQSADIRNSQGVTDPASAEKSQALLRNLSSGDTITGQMIAREGDVVQLLLNDETVIQAKLDREMQMQPGQLITFTVRNTSNGNIALAPLFTNTTDMKTAAKALMNAGLSVNNGNMKMVSSMMEEGLPIGRDSLVYMKGQSALFSNADVTNLVQMHRMGISMTEQNVEQFSAYKNFEHQVLNAANHIGELVSDTLGEMVSSNPSEVVAFFDTILDLVTGNGNMISEGESAAAGIMSSGEETGAIGEGQGISVNQQNELPQNTADQNATSQNEAAQKVAVQNATTQNVVARNGAVQDADATLAMLQKLMGENENPAMPEKLMGIEGKEGQSGEVNLQEELTHQAGRTIEDGVSEKTQVLIDQLMRDLETYAGQNDTTKQWLEAFSKGKISGAELLKYLKQECKDPDQLKELLSNKGVQKLLGKSLTDAWKLTAEQTSSKAEVKELYKRMEEQTRQIMDALQAGAKADSPLANAVTRLQNNLDFMNQLNQMFPYVQLPLALSGSEAHGELYVYTNKKNLAKENGAVSALLHLDMEHLGTVDVMVKMNAEQHVNTNFMVESEEILDLIEAHLDELTARLNKRGYRMETSCSLQEDSSSVMDKMIEQDRPISVISTTAFDARA